MGVHPPVVLASRSCPREDGGRGPIPLPHRHSSSPSLPVSSRRGPIPLNPNVIPRRREESRYKHEPSSLTSSHCPNSPPPASIPPFPLPCPRDPPPYLFPLPVSSRRRGPIPLNPNVIPRRREESRYKHKPSSLTSSHCPNSPSPASISPWNLPFPFPFSSRIRGPTPSHPPPTLQNPLVCPTFFETSPTPETNHLRHKLIPSRLSKRVKTSPFTLPSFPNPIRGEGSNLPS